jgi:hypothetical protein
MIRTIEIDRYLVNGAAEVDAARIEAAQVEAAEVETDGALGARLPR